MKSILQKLIIFEKEMDMIYYKFIQNQYNLKKFKNKLENKYYLIQNIVKIFKKLYLYFKIILKKMNNNILL